MICRSNLFASPITLLALAMLSVEAGRAAADDETSLVHQRRSGLFAAVSHVAHVRRRPAQRSLSGGGPKTAQLIGLIQGTVEPDCWDPTPAMTVAPGNASPSAVQLVEVLQQNVQPPTWDVNGGLGTIMIVPW